MQNQPTFISFPPLKDWSLSAAVAGVLASTMGYAGPLVILFQVAESANLSSEVLTSWIWGMSIARETANKPRNLVLEPAFAFAV